MKKNSQQQSKSFNLSTFFNLDLELRYGAAYRNLYGRQMVTIKSPLDGARLYNRLLRINPILPGGGIMAPPPLP